MERKSIVLITAITLAFCSLKSAADDQEIIAVVYKNEFFQMPPDDAVKAMNLPRISKVRVFKDAEECIQFGKSEVNRYDRMPAELREMATDMDRPLSNPNAKFSWVAECFESDEGESQSFWRESGPIY